MPAPAVVDAAPGARLRSLTRGRACPHGPAMMARAVARRPRALPPWRCAPVARPLAGRGTRRTRGGSGGRCSFTRATSHVQSRSGCRHTTHGSASASRGSRSGFRSAAKRSCAGFTRPPRLTCVKPGYPKALSAFASACAHQLKLSVSHSRLRQLTVLWSSDGAHTVDNLSTTMASSSSDAAGIEESARWLRSRSMKGLLGSRR